MDAFDHEFAELISQFDDQPGFSVERAKALLGELLERTEGQLSRAQAEAIGDLAGRDARTVYRWRDKILDPEATDGPSLEELSVDDGTVLDRLVGQGPSSFAFDDEMVSLMYLCGGNQRLLRRELAQAGYPVPSEATICRRWKAFPPLVRRGAKVGLRERSKSILHVRYSADAPNDVWQFDAFNLDIFVRTPGGTTPIRPTALILIDDHSRFITSAAIVPHAMRTEDVLAVFGAGYELRAAANGTGVMIGGLPEVVAFDNDQAILAATEFLALLPTSLRPLPAYSPTRKGKVERVGQTIQAELVTGRPGWVTKSEQFNGRHLLATRAEHLLTFEQFTELFHAAIYEYNYERVHGALKRRTPFDAYSGNTVHRRVADADLAELMLPVPYASGRRKVLNDGLHVFSSYYADPAIGPLVGSSVLVRSWHHRHDRVAVFHDGKFVAMASQANDLTADDRRALLVQQVEYRRAVQHHARIVRAAMVETGRAVELGGDTSRVAAVVRATAMLNAERNAGGEPPSPKAPAGKNSNGNGDGASPANTPASKPGDTPAEVAPQLAAKNPAPARHRPPPTAAETRKVPTRRRAKPSSAAQAGRNAAAAALDDEASS